ncbi:hypothetical protein LEN26_021279 [Aphanomyces euteiches]|nr:hypothetical protein LEN26_021279 [Aphanomyces euteiches]KAH9123414.1 hypothetical protein AeMF1_005586 [Aphanomyces euteiches]
MLPFQPVMALPVPSTPPSLRGATTSAPLSVARPTFATVTSVPKSQRAMDSSALAVMEMVAVVTASQRHAQAADMSRAEAQQGPAQGVDSGSDLRNK